MTPAEAFTELLKFIETLPPADQRYAISRDSNGVVRVQIGWNSEPDAGIGEVEGILRGIEAAKKGMEKV